MRCVVAQVWLLHGVILFCFMPNTVFFQRRTLRGQRGHPDKAQQRGRAGAAMSTLLQTPEKTAPHHSQPQRFLLPQLLGLSPHTGMPCWGEGGDGNARG